METLNEVLERYTDENCNHLYCQVTDQGNLQMDGYFEPKHMKAIFEILNLYGFLEN